MKKTLTDDERRQIVIDHARARMAEWRKTRDDMQSEMMKANEHIKATDILPHDAKGRSDLIEAQQRREQAIREHNATLPNPIMIVYEAANEINGIEHALSFAARDLEDMIEYLPTKAARFYPS